MCDVTGPRQLPLRAPLHDERRHVAVALARATRTGELRGQAYSLNGLACDLCETGELAGALRKHEQALALNRERPDRQLEAHVLHDQGRTLEAAGRPHEAIDAFRGALAIAAAINSPDSQAQALHGLADVLTQAGQPEQARAAKAEANALYRQCGLPEIE